MSSRIILDFSDPGEIDKDIPTLKLKHHESYSSYTPIEEEIELWSINTGDPENDRIIHQCEKCNYFTRTFECDECRKTMCVRCLTETHDETHSLKTYFCGSFYCDRCGNALNYLNGSWWFDAKTDLDVCECCFLPGEDSKLTKFDSPIQSYRSLREWSIVLRSKEKHAVLLNVAKSSPNYHRVALWFFNDEGVSAIHTIDGNLVDTVKQLEEFLEEYEHLEDDCSWERCYTSPISMLAQKNELPEIRD